eukprot:gene47573-biopygen39029
MLLEMDEDTLNSFTKSWPASNFTHCLESENQLMIRNTPFLVGRVGQNVFVGIVVGTLSNTSVTADSKSTSDVLCFAELVGAFPSFGRMSLIFEQLEVLYPTWIYLTVQSLVMFPLMIIETVVLSTIVYRSVGLLVSLSVTQFFRLLAGVLPSAIDAQPLAAIVVMLMILFSGFIVPKSNIPAGWEWFYRINPIAYVLSAVTTNEFLAPDYDYLVCPDAACVEMKRFGNVVLESRGNKTEQVWVWYSIAILIGFYLFFLFLTLLSLTYFKIEPIPPPPIVIDYSDDKVEEDKADKVNVAIPFEPVSFAFKDVWYTVTLPTGDDLDLLRGVSGYFEPGTVTALMGSSGAGKTTLLDVLAGRKNTGIVKGGIFVNGKPVEKHSFRQMMGYVEQFDSLAPNDTAREAI